jgi:hypothetical protein
MEEQTQLFKRLIKKQEQLTYIEVPFTMPKGVKQFHVAYEVFAEGEAVVDLGVVDPFRVRGWSGGARSEFYIGLDDATPGYLSGELHQGDWTVILGAYRIPEDGCTVKVKASFQFNAEMKKHRWLKGDLHMHSVHSDGSYTLEEIRKIAEAKGLDFVALTDHNTVSQNRCIPKSEKVVFIPGMELTTYFGHSNLLGVKDPIKDFRVQDLSDIHAHLKEARENGARIALNHPHCPNCPWEWGWGVDYDWIEVWNGPWRQANAETLAWWHDQLVLGQRLVAVGGSDTHRPHPFVQHGMPTTWVYSHSHTIGGILEAIENGQVFMSYAPDGPTIELSCGSYMMGDVLSVNDEEVSLRIDRLEGGDIVKIISDRGEETQLTVKQTSFETMFQVNGRNFYRIEVLRKFPEGDQPLLAAMSNPIYF